MLTLQEEEAQHNDDGSATMLFSLAPIPLHKLSLLQGYYDEFRQNGPTMKAYVNRLSLAVDPLPDETMTEWKAQSLLARTPHVMYSDHARQIIQLRQHFTKAIFLVPGRESQLYPFKFVYASQKPFTLQLLCLEFLEVDLVEPVPDLSTIRESALQDITFSFQVKEGWNYTSSDVLGCADVKQILVLQTSLYTANGWISRDYAENLALVLQSLLSEIPRRVRTTGTGRTATSSRKRSISDREGEDADASVESDTGSDGVADVFYETGETAEPDKTGGGPDKDFENIWDEVEEARTILEEHTEVTRDDFKIAILGGAWQQKRVDRA
eukprot:104985-Amphidinium_carterae.1